MHRFHYNLIIILLGWVGHSSQPKNGSNMKKSIFERIQDAVNESKNFPNPVIEYSFDLPDNPNITPTDFFGVRAVFNNRVQNERGYQVTYKL